MSQNITAVLQVNYQLLAQLFGGTLIDLPDATKSERKPFMDLHFDKLTDGPLQEIALHHSYMVNGDCVPDPDMRIRLDHAAQTAEALSYQDSMVYCEVYHGGGARNERQYRSQNQFLQQWLRNCIGQGHVLRQARVQS